MPLANHIPNEPPDLRVMLRDTRGKYLAQDDNGLFFTENRSAALVFSYHSDQVAEQLEVLRKSEGISLLTEPIPPEEIYETCDRCKELFVPWMTFYDGHNFLCGECRQLSSPRKRPQKFRP